MPLALGPAAFELWGIHFRQSPDARVTTITCTMKALKIKGIYSINLMYIYDPILENCRYMHNSTFVINCNIKTMGKIKKFNNKIMQVIDCLNTQ